MMIAIVGTHYFEFYAEQGESENSIFVNLMHYYIDKNKDLLYGYSRNRPLSQRLKAAILRKIDSWLLVIVDDENSNQGMFIHIIHIL